MTLNPPSYLYSNKKASETGTDDAKYSLLPFESIMNDVHYRLNKCHMHLEKKKRKSVRKSLLIVIGSSF